MITYTGIPNIKVFLDFWTVICKMLIIVSLQD